MKAKGSLAHDELIKAVMSQLTMFAPNPKVRRHFLSPSHLTLVSISLPLLASSTMHRSVD
jgi:hypothetical protein